MNQMHFAARYRAIIWVTVGFAVMGCSESILEPGAEPRVPHQLRQTLVSSMPDDSHITVVDNDDGTVYTLDIPDQQIQRSDGRVLHLDLDETLAAADAFNATIVADDVVNDMDDAGLRCEAHPAMCEEPTGPQPMDPGANVAATSTFSSALMFGRKITTKKDGTPYPTWAGKYAHATIRQTESSVSSEGDICSDIVNAALPKKLTYLQVRTGLVRQMFDQAVQDAGGAPTDYILGAGAWSGIVQNGYVAAHMDASVGVGVLALYWNSYSCGSRPVHAGPIYRWTGWEEGDAGVQRICHTEDAWVSFNNRDWYPIDLTICEYKRMT